MPGVVSFPILSENTGLLRERTHVSGLGPHGVDVGRDGRRDHRLFDEERAVSLTRVGIATGRDMLRRPCSRPILRDG